MQHFVVKCCVHFPPELEISFSASSSKHSCSWAEAQTQHRTFSWCCSQAQLLSEIKQNDHSLQRELYGVHPLLARNTVQKIVRCRMYSSIADKEQVHTVCSTVLEIPGSSLPDTLDSARTKWHCSVLWCLSDTRFHTGQHQNFRFSHFRFQFYFVEKL